MRNSPDYREVTKAVQEIHRDLGIDDPPVNPVSVARSLGINVKFVTFSGDSAKVSGFYDPKEHAIYINKEEWPLRQTFSIAHELGHAVLHRDWAKSESYKVLWRDADRNDAEDFHEKEANAFAAHLLVPRRLLNRYRNLSQSNLSKLFAVSAPVIKNRMDFEYGF